MLGGGAYDDDVARLVDRAVGAEEVVFVGIDLAELDVEPLLEQGLLLDRLGARRLARIPIQACVVDIDQKVGALLVGAGNPVSSFR